MPEGERRIENDLLPARSFVERVPAFCSLHATHQRPATKYATARTAATLSVDGRSAYAISTRALHDRKEVTKNRFVRVPYIANDSRLMNQFHLWSARRRLLKTATPTGSIGQRIGESRWSD
jgi:hypothetical protein